MVDLPSSVWSVCPVLVIAVPPPGTRGLVDPGLGTDMWVAGRVAGGCDSSSLLLLLPGLSSAGLAATGTVDSRRGELIGSLATADVDEGVAGVMFRSLAAGIR